MNEVAEQSRAEQSRDVCVANFKALMLLAIVVYHTWGAVREYVHTPQIIPSNYISWFSSSLSYCLSCFFMISGYFSWHGQGELFEFLKKKIHSIVIPYISWNVIYILFFLIGSFFLTVIKNRVAGLELNSFWGIVKCIVGYPRPADGPLWYLRDLFLLLLFSPILYISLKRFPLVLLGILLIGNFLQILPFSFYEIVSFCFGIFLRQRNISLRFLCKYRKTGVVFLFLFLTVTWIYYMLPQNQVVQGMLWDLGHFLLIPALFPWLDKLTFPMDSLSYRLFTAPAFYTYALHGLIMSFCARLLVVKMPQSPFLALGALLFSIVVGMICILGSYQIIRKLFPKMLNILCGSRN